MLNIFNSIIPDTGVTPAVFIIMVLVSLVLGGLLALVHTYKNDYTKSFVMTLALLPAVVSVVILMVNGNIGAGVAVAGAFSLVRFRSAPGTAREIGAIFAAIIAASIGNVPLPQNGSTRIRSGLHGVSISRDAASVSVSGALLVKVRYPLLCRESPDVSSVTITSSFNRKMRTGYGAPSSGNHSL